MVKFRYIVQVVFLLLLGCKSQTFLTNNPRVENSKVCGGVYLYNEYIYKYSTEKIKQKDGNFMFKQIKSDSILLFKGYKFFANGIFRHVESQKKVDSSFIMVLLNRRALDKSDWGIYEIKADSIKMFSWEPTSGNPIIEKRGVIRGGNEIVLFMSRCSDCGRLDGRNKWFNYKKVYNFYQVNVKTDSTFHYIKTVVK